MTKRHRTSARSMGSKATFIWPMAIVSYPGRIFFLTQKLSSSWVCAARPMSAGNAPAAHHQLNRGGLPTEPIFPTKTSALPTSSSDR